MHRIASFPQEDPTGELTLVEQPTAPVIFLTNAQSDIKTISAVLEENTNLNWSQNIRALQLDSLQHPAQIDHYLETTAAQTKILVIRILGGRGHWSYGIEQAMLWQEKAREREVIFIAGTSDQDTELNSLSSVNIEIPNFLARLFREGGKDNIYTILEILWKIINSEKITINNYKINIINDPHRWDWKEEKGYKVGVLFYRSLYKSDDMKMIKELNLLLRESSLVPRPLMISSLRNYDVQRYILNIFKKEDVKLIITMTSFASVDTEDSDQIDCIWNKINKPVLQILSSSKTRENWESSKRGIEPIDLSLQVVLPEIDGRITTTICGFRSEKNIDKVLSTRVYEQIGYSKGLKWVVSHAKKWINLQIKSNRDKSLSIVMANYPVRNGRIANGVGLDTPNSIVAMLSWLKLNNYELGKNKQPKNGNDLIRRLTSKRTNDPESYTKLPLDYLPLATYKIWWDSLDERAKQPIIKRWGIPETSIDLEDKGYPITGIRFGKVLVLIQPSRGYDSNQIEDLHSPDLPPPHKYLAFYLWLNVIEKVDIIIHTGKHGTLEWLPGKSTGLSDYCYPHLALGTTPNLYPFIVNDPGEGSQAKRRTNAVIIDHLTPPLARSELYGDYIALESLIDEYYSCRDFAVNRAQIIKTKIEALTIKLSLNMDENLDSSTPSMTNNEIDIIDSYLCTIKETQIRTGLHTFGVRPLINNLVDLITCISRSPSSSGPGLTQIIATELGFELDPWSCDEANKVSKHDLEIAKRLLATNIRKNGDIIEWIEKEAQKLVRILLIKHDQSINFSTNENRVNDRLKRLLIDSNNVPTIKHIYNYIIPRVLDSANNEKLSFLKALNGQRIESGPSGAPTRSRPEVLPTGRNFYSVDLRGLPTESAWEIGKKTAENIINNFIQEKGSVLKKLAISAWGTSTMRNGGEDIAQLFALIGVQPIWDGPTRRMVDLEVIPLSLLGRPRVDVTLRISGFFRDAFPQLINWVSKAQRMVASLDEDEGMNPLSASKYKLGQEGRIYGSAPGSYGAGLQEIIDSGNWETKKELADAFIAWSKWSYDISDEIIEDKIGLINALQGTQVVMHNQDNREHDILDSDDYYQFQGGLATTVESITGIKPSIYLGDNSRKERTRLKTIKEEIEQVVRTRLLNPKWLKGIMKHGYKGAFEIGASLDYLFAFDATTDQVSDWCYKEITNQWILDKDLQKFLLDNNPWVLRSMAERLLEANNRKMWQNATQRQIESLKIIIAKAEVKVEFDSY